MGLVSGVDGFWLADEATVDAARRGEEGST